jgi:hypothetical protein
MLPEESELKFSLTHGATKDDVFTPKNIQKTTSSPEKEDQILAFSTSIPVNVVAVDQYNQSQGQGQQSSRGGTVKQKNSLKIKKKVASPESSRGTSRGGKKSIAIQEKQNDDLKCETAKGINLFEGIRKVEKSQTMQFSTTKKAKP